MLTVIYARSRFICSSADIACKAPDNRTLLKLLSAVSVWNIRLTPQFDVPVIVTAIGGKFPKLN
jgi:hypothetical protein